MRKIQLLIVLSLFVLAGADSKKPCIRFWTGTGSSLNFGTILQGEEKTLSVRVANRCQTPTAVTLAISGTPFQSAELPASFILPKHKRITLQIHFTPTQAGEYQELLTAMFAAETKSITLKGIALIDGTILPPEEDLGDDSVLDDADDNAYEEITLEELPGLLEPSESDDSFVSENPEESTDVIEEIEESIPALEPERMETSATKATVTSLPLPSTRAQIRYDIRGRIVQGMPGPYQWTSNR